jgi:hypothetical protein
MEIEEREEVTLLLDSLQEDVSRIKSGEVTEGIEWIARVYGDVLAYVSASAGYPRLFRLAWLLLHTSVAARDWTTLRQINAVFSTAGIQLQDLSTTTISLWHLKAILFCWAYIADSRQLGVEFDVRLMGVRRTNTQAEDLLRRATENGCFLNMSPTEAESRLLVSFDGAFLRRPYIFRLSTTLPGVMTCSFVTPQSRLIVHRRFKPGSIPDLRDSGLYDYIAYDCINEHLAGQERLDSGTLLRVLISSMESGEVTRRLAQLQSLLNEAMQRDVDRSDAVKILRTAFWHKLQLTQLVPEDSRELAGLSLSYIASYSERMRLSACFVCKREATLIEPLNNALYCSEPCMWQDSSTYP